jgi:hypothetical protein
MLKDLIYKELRLNAHLLLSPFLLLAALLLIPEWPYYVAFIYLFVAVMTLAQNDKANNDLVFAALLPVRKKDIVAARTWMLVGWELAYLLVAAVSAALRMRFYPHNNGASMNTNLAFFGTAFLTYGIFNAFYIAGSYRKPYRMLWPLVGGSVISFVVAVILNNLPLFIPAVSSLFNDNGFGHLPYQAVALAVGLAVFVGATIWANKRGAANFERVDL